MSTLIINEKGSPILEEQDGIKLPADYSFDCINNYVNCESPQYEDLQSLALGMSSHIAALREVLELARNGLQWYQDNNPEAVSETDYETMERIDAVLKGGAA